MSITRDEARHIAQRYVESMSASSRGGVAEAISELHIPEIRRVHSAEGIDRPPLIYGLRVPLEECWIAYLTSRGRGLHSSAVVLISKDSGQVVYSGSAHDEG